MSIRATNPYESGLETTLYVVLDLIPKGRYATGPHGNLTDWVRRHDEYDNVKATTQSCCLSVTCWRSASVREAQDGPTDSRAIAGMSKVGRRSVLSDGTQKAVSRIPSGSNSRGRRNSPK